MPHGVSWEKVPSGYVPKLGEHRRAQELGRDGHELYIWALCEDCQIARWVVVTGRKEPTRRCLKCSNKNHAKIMNGNHRPPTVWKGGKFKDRLGYTLVFIDSSHKFFGKMKMRMSKSGLRAYVHEHRLVMAEMIG